MRERQNERITKAASTNASKQAEKIGYVPRNKQVSLKESGLASAGTLKLCFSYCFVFSWAVLSVAKWTYYFQEWWIVATVRTRNWTRSLGQVCAASKTPTKVGYRVTISYYKSLIIIIIIAMTVSEIDAGIDAIGKMVDTLGHVASTIKDEVRYK